MIEIKASMAGTVWKVLVSVGDTVQAGQDVVILESMKMEIPVTVEQTGQVSQIEVAEGQFIGEGEVLLRLEGK
ncbi:acetyl-CoA carboxylase biotin carboxyl carrier protein subunit [Risungbinella massiliensis]|uniref:acetyl-CoA carboxylase biotin carboxyl carrier protein subunit n=1 Tax=Risungbinella massiliensis TaxID=1329796 RepID=UPI0005CC53B6|nr:acetyl-CoA carboxylase biotin carboxyl carrier protein subunit [Risungbinella massiliensis]